jgi:EAL domain-containing protein (putative c-di-GMP-specific phosphodiesterase class I)
LTLELVENQPLDLSHRYVMPNLTQLSCLGVEFAIDDFGSGYATPARVRRLLDIAAFAFSCLKLDLALMRQWQTAAGRRRIECAVDLAQTYRLQVVAEGIETKEQLDYARRLGCLAQGFYIGQKFPLEHLTGWLDARRHELLAA